MPARPQPIGPFRIPGAPHLIANPSTATGKMSAMHPSTAEILRHFKYDHLPPALQDVSRPICDLAHQAARELDGPELTAGLRKLLEAKDCFVRAALP